MKHYIGSLSVALLFSCASAAGAQWNPGGGDHGGDDWTPPNGETIWGVHTNVGVFKVASGVVVDIKAEAGSNLASIEVNCDSAVIDGIINGIGKGFFANANTSSAGKEGSPTGPALNDWGGGGGGGNGGAGGDGGVPANGGDGGVIAGTAGDEAASIGSGGGHAYAVSQGFGGDGGPGGAGIKIKAATGGITVSGSILADGAFGLSAAFGFGGGGGGAGGSIVLVACAGDVVNTGVLSVIGGDGGIAFSVYNDGGGGGGGGGYIKLIATGSTTIGTALVLEGLGGSSSGGNPPGDDGNPGVVVTNTITECVFVELNCINGFDDDGDGFVDCDDSDCAPNSVCGGPGAGPGGGGGGSEGDGHPGRGPGGLFTCSSTPAGHAAPMRPLACALLVVLLGVAARRTLTGS